MAGPPSLRPAIVVVAHNRAAALARLLRSLSRAWFPEEPVPLVISVDGSDRETHRVARDFRFPCGPTTLITREPRLGLVDHIRTCAGLSEEYGSVILLEDDLAVAPGFHVWACQALTFYEGSPEVAGVSLYRYSMTEATPAPFEPIDDGCDAHFIQFPSSWGQAWTAAQWRLFLEWDRCHSIEEGEALLPGYVRRWRGPSWKRRFAAYLIATDRYFVFPPVSLSTNFGDPGTSAVTPGLYQVTLDRRRRDYRFSPLSDSRSVYDSYFELTPRCLNRWTDALRGFRYDVDLYGVKSLEHLREEHVLTTRPAGEPQRTFGLALTPNVANVIDGVEGEGIRLVPRARVEATETPAALHYPVLASVADRVFRSEPPPKAAPPAYLSLISVEREPGLASGISRAVAAQRPRGGAPFDTVAHILVGRGVAPDVQPGRDSNAPRVLALRGPEEMAEDELFLWGAARCDGEVMGCLPADAELRPGALYEVESLFRALPQIQWLAGLPGRGRSRATPSEVIRNAREGRLGWAGVFWRRAVWEKAVADLSPRPGRHEFWKRLGAETGLHVALHVFAEEPADVKTRPMDSSADRSGAASGVKSDQAPANRAGAPARASVKALVATLTERFHRDDVPGLSFVHSAARLEPYIAVLNAASGRVLLWTYPS